MTALLWGLLLLSGLALLAVIALPVHLRLRAEAGAALRFRAEARLVAGLTPALPVFDSTGGRKPRPAPGRPSAAAPGRKRRRKPDAGGRGRALRMVRAAPRLLGGVLRRVHLDRVAVTGVFGLADPAETGQLYGWLALLIHAPRPPRVALDLRPDFTGPSLAGQAEVALYLTPIALLGPVLRFGWDVFVVPR
ncbi:DUF2953 domain-containing protein [Defluviimonas sp. WL0024]|uniref:DUF2953 domain-containing protein n=1 Tax=Albidovulum salinarum TaxID=2984153 RepID=A0ABT2X0J6_9RHOB|nr:DUF2953 domain-containing protein [Defluviimonas sp. WL0024]MCU9847453.1 DUF2953 domain-containing protein [Defluviimonas sp. WL0024]